MLFRALLLVGATLLLGQEGLAQVVRGRVLADSSLVGVVGAELWLEGTVARVRSGPDGSYRLLGPTGTFALKVRAVGYRPLEAQAVLTSADTLDVDFLLAPQAAQLAPLEVTAAAERPLTANMRGFHDRRAEGLGRFLERADLEKWDHGPVTDALRMIAGITLQALPCSGGYAVATTRGRATLQEPIITCTGIRGTLILPRACYLSVYLDGVRLWTWGAGPPPNMDEILTMDLEAVEVYRGPAELPIAYQTTGSACGAVLFWTRVQ